MASEPASDESMNPLPSICGWGALIFLLAGGFGFLYALDEITPDPSAADWDKVGMGVAVGGGGVAGAGFLMLARRIFKS